MTKLPRFTLHALQVAFGYAAVVNTSKEAYTWPLIVLSHCRLASFAEGRAVSRKNGRRRKIQDEVELPGYTGFSTAGIRLVYVPELPPPQRIVTTSY